MERSPAADLSLPEFGFGWADTIIGRYPTTFQDGVHDFERYFAALKFIVSVQDLRFEVHQLALDDRGSLFQFCEPLCHWRTMNSVVPKLSH